MSPAATTRNGTGRKAAGNDAAPARLPLGEEVVLRPTFRRERVALKRGVWPVAGCDEAGRGPLAGPVVAAAVILDPDNIPRGLDDSKRLTPERRAVLYERICARAQVAVAFAPPARIDRDNILRASLWALARAVAALPVKPRLVFVDGRDRIDARGVDRRQGHAGPFDDVPRRGASRLRLRAAQGLQRSGAFCRSRAARPDY